MSAYKIIEVVGTSAKSFEEAVQEAVSSASASLRNLRIAEVVKFDVTVDLRTADTGSSERDESLATSDFFDTAKTPTAHFVTESFAKAADGSVEAKGNLTIRNQTKPVTLKTKFAENGNAATLDVDTTLKRADFGLGVGSDWADIGADVPVHAHLVLTAK